MKPDEDEDPYEDLTVSRAGIAAYVADGRTTA